MTSNLLLKQIFFLLVVVSYLRLSVGFFNSKSRESNGGSLFGKKNSNDQEEVLEEAELAEEPEEENERFLLPQLPPHPDKQSILEFYIEKNPSCEYMRPIIKRIEKKFNLKIKRIPLMERADYLQLYETVGGNEYGNVPFYYNRRTAQAIGGATSFDNLSRLVSGTPHLFSDPPDFEVKKNEYNPDVLRGIGIQNYLRERVGKKIIQALKPTAEKKGAKKKKQQSSKRKNNS